MDTSWVTLMTLKKQLHTPSVMFIGAFIIFFFPPHTRLWQDTVSLLVPVCQSIKTCWTPLSPMMLPAEMIKLRSKAILFSGHMRVQSWRVWQGQDLATECVCVCWIIRATDRSLPGRGLMILVAMLQVTTHEYILTIYYTVKHTPRCLHYSSYKWTHGHELHTQETSSKWEKGGEGVWLGEVPCAHLSSKRWMNILIITPSTHHAAHAIICFPLHHGFNQVKQTQKGPQQYPAASRDTDQGQRTQLVRVKSHHWRSWLS